MIQLREVTEEDLADFFVHQLDEEANRMAAFGAKDPADKDAFDLHWKEILSDPVGVKRTVTYDGAVAGYVTSYEFEGHTELCYWIDKALWGKGVATAALEAFLKELPQRPLYARATMANRGSIRVLERCGFVKIRQERAFAPSLGETVEEAIFVLTGGTEGQIRSG